jgi:hypothetical protein
LRPSGWTRLVLFLAAFVWHAGIVALFWRGAVLLQQADALRPGHLWPWLGVPAALLIGGLKARFLLRRAVRSNRARIVALAHPRPWHVYRPGFFLFLVANVLAARWLIVWSRGHYALTILCGTMLLSIAVALLASAPLWWRGGDAASLPLDSHVRRRQVRPDLPRHDRPAGSR